MGVKSGKDGTATWASAEVASLAQWTLVDLSENKDYHTNDSGAARKRVAGIKDSNGSFRVLDQPDGVTTGQSAELVMYDNEDIATVTVIIDSITPTNDVNTGDIVGYDVVWSGNGVLEWTTGSYSP